MYMEIILSRDSFSLATTNSKVHFGLGVLIVKFSWLKVGPIWIVIKESHDTLIIKQEKVVYYTV